MIKLCHIMQCLTNTVARIFLVKSAKILEKIDITNYVARLKAGRLNDIMYQFLENKRVDLKFGGKNEKAFWQTG